MPKSRDGCLQQTRLNSESGSKSAHTLQTLGITLQDHRRSTSSDESSLSRTARYPPRQHESRSTESTSTGGSPTLLTLAIKANTALSLMTVVSIPCLARLLASTCDIIAMHQESNGQTPVSTRQREQNESTYVRWAIDKRYQSQVYTRCSFKKMHPYSFPQESSIFSCFDCCEKDMLPETTQRRL